MLCCSNILTSLLTCGYNFRVHSDSKTWGSVPYKVRAVKAMKTEKGKRWWLVAWESIEGTVFDDSWEPTKNLSEDLMLDFRNNEKEKLERTISVDSRPLDSLVQRSVATAVVKNPDDSFGHTHAIEIGALALADLAEHYMYLQSVATTYNVRIKEEYDPKSKVVTRELRLTVPEDVGEFCSFEKLYSQKAIKHVRYTGDRAQNVDLIVVGIIMLRTLTNKRTPGLVTTEAEVHTIWVNGASGVGVGPHLTTGFITLDSNLQAAVAHARSIIPSSHPLHQA